MTLAIKTNHQYRNLMNFYELSKQDQEYNEDNEEGTFFEYKGMIYDLGDFMSIQGCGLAQSEDFCKWDGYHSDGYWSGVLVKYSDCGDTVKVGRYTS